MGDRSGWNVIVFAMAMVVGCETTPLQTSGGARVLTGAEMDLITAGSVIALSEATAHALGSASQTAVSAATLTDSTGSPITSPPFLNFARSTASASSDEFAKASLSNHISVVGANGGAWVDASGTSTAMGNGTNHAQVSTQTYGLTTNRADLVFGSVAAIACCGSLTTSQIKVNSGTGGLYSRELRGISVLNGSGQIQSSIDIALVSSALPIVDPTQMLVTGAPPRILPKY